MKVAVAVVCAVLAAPLALAAQDHVVPPLELRKDVREASAVRQRNADQLRAFLNSDLARQATAAARLDSAKIDRAIASLSDQELAALAAKSGQIQNDFAAGSLTSTQVTYIIFGAILIIVVAIVV